MNDTTASPPPSTASPSPPPLPPTPITVVCLEGAHGCGKTEVGRALAAAGFPVLDEGFLNMPAQTLHPQTFVMESLWVAKWVERLLELHTAAQGEAQAPRLYFADRSPYSAACYARENGDLLEPLIGQQMRDLCEHGISVYTVYLQLEEDTLWERIQERLVREPGRAKFREDQRSWMDTVVEFYEERVDLVWDTVVDRSDLDVKATAEAVLYWAESQGVTTP